MLRRPIMAGNWKMNKTRDEALQFIYAINKALPAARDVETIICAPFVLLRCLVKRQGEDLRIAAQNMHFEDNGAFTGEVSAPMLKTTGVEHVIIGHSERREMFNETDDAVNRKIHTALKHGITAIVCCGETLQEREDNAFKEVLERQITKAYANVTKDKAAKTVIAYEPIWAIGTGRTASASQADEACGFIRSVIAKLFGQDTADEIRILYGGSVKTSNIKELMEKENIDGALVGGASLEPQSFTQLAHACKY